jgi:arylsulfatase A-like enzyme
VTRPNVLLVVLDSVRAANVGFQGYYRETTPFLTEYADGATVYEQARAPGIHSVASHASLWTGDHVESHGVVRHEDELKPGTSIWESLSEDGYETGIFTTNPVVAHASNLSEPFDTRVTDEFVDTETKLFPEAHGPADVVTHEGIVGNLQRSIRDDHPLRSLANNVHHFVAQKRSSRNDATRSSDIVDEFEQWHAERTGPWAACINLMDAHFPYEPSPEFNEWGDEKLVALHADLDRPPANAFVQSRPWWQLKAFSHLYDGAVRELDSHVQRIVSTLRRRDAHDGTLVVVTSDHGEGFGELSRLTGRTRMVDHSWGIHEVLTHVPLLVKYPEQTVGDRVEELASLVAFPDTVDSLRDGEVDTDSFVSDGPVVASTTRLREADDAIFENGTEDASDYYGPWRALYDREDGRVSKYIQRGEQCIEIDFDARHNHQVVGEISPSVVREAFQSLPERDVRKEGATEIRADVEDRLTDLGYIR